MDNLQPVQSLQREELWMGIKEAVGGALKGNTEDKDQNMVEYKGKHRVERYKIDRSTDYKERKAEHRDTLRKIDKLLANFKRI